MRKQHTQPAIEQAFQDMSRDELRFVTGGATPIEGRPAEFNFLNYRPNPAGDGTRLLQPSSNSRGLNY